MSAEKTSIFGFQNWSGEIRKYLTVDCIAGFTLWAMIVPEAVAYATMANAPTPAAGLYGILFVLPVYAIFASSRYVVATSTAAISVTTAGFLAALGSGTPEVFSSLIITSAIVYLLFWHFRLGFIADFISEPVSRGFMLGLSIFIVVGQLPKLFGIEKGSGNTFEQAFSLAGNLGDTNPATLICGALVAIILIGSEKINPRIPGGLLALVLSVIGFSLFGWAGRYGIDMVGALPAGLPAITIPRPDFAQLPIIIPAAIGLVVLAISEATVLASSLAIEHDQELDVDQQFLAFGLGNLAGGLFGGLLGAGSTSSTLVNHDAGAKTLMSTVWAALFTLVTILFLTGLFAFLPEVFLGVLIIHAVWHLLRFRKILHVRNYSRGEFNLAAIAMLAVLLFDVLYGLVIAMALNIIYFAYKTSRVKVEEFGTLNDSNHTLMPVSFEHVVPAPDNCIALGLTQGSIFYASARSAVEQSNAIIRQHPDATNVIISVERINSFDFTSQKMLRDFEAMVRKSGKRLYITNVRSQHALDQLRKAGFDPALVDISLHLDITKI